MSNSITKCTTTTSTLALKDTNNTTSNHNIVMSNTTVSTTNANKANSTNMKNNVNTNTGAVLMLNRKQFTPTTDTCNASFSSASVAGSIQDDMSDQCSLTQAGLEEYNIRASSYYDQPVLFHHQKQSSYAQSEGYHSYVSSSDSSSATPFLDRLRQESDLLSRQSHHWSQNDLSSVSCNSVAPSPTPLAVNQKHDHTTNDDTDTHQLHQQQNNSSESTSSTETLKWLGSMSDVSEASHATGYSAISESVSSSQLIVHSSRVLTPKRHHSESVLYLNNEHQQHSPNSTQTKQQINNLKVSPTLSAREDHSPIQLTPHHRHSPSYPPVHTTQTIQPYQKQSISAKRELITVDLPKSSLVAATETASAATTKLITITPTSISPTATQTPTCDLQQHKSNISVTISNSEAVVTISPQPPACNLVKCDTVSNVANNVTGNVAAKSVSNQSATDAALPTSDTHVTVTNNIANSTAATTAATANATATATAAITATSYRSNHRLFPVSTYTEPIHSNTSHYVHHPKPQFSAGLQKPVNTNATVNAPANNNNNNNNSAAALQTKPTTTASQTSPTANWHSVAELISDFERVVDNEPEKYTYIDPSKTHRISNPALKAFQKNAVQSYFERQQQQQQQQSQQHAQQQTKDNNQQKIYQPHPSHHHLQHQQLLRPHSYQSVTSIKEAVGQQALRNSLPNTYAANVALTNSMRANIATTTQTNNMSQKSISSDSLAYTTAHNLTTNTKPPSPAPPPPPPRSRSLMATTLLRRSSSASDYAEFRDQFISASQEKLQAQSIKNISNAEKMSFNDCGMPPPPPPPRARAPMTTRRTSSASEYAAMRDKVLLQHAAAIAHQQHHPHQHQHNKPTRAPHYYAPPTAMLAAHDGWVPERPPKNPNLRVPSPDLPPPPLEVDTNPSDEPLPPPPPEILHRQPAYFETENIAALSNNTETTLAAAISPNRRNSFAGSSTRKLYNNRSASSTHDMPVKAPPLIPKKPTNIEILQVSRPTASLVQQTNKAHKVLLNGGAHMQQAQVQPTLVPQTAKVTTSRKRPHNPALITVPPIIENQAMNSPVHTSPTGINSITVHMNKSSPPPLMPRMLINHQTPAAVAINNKQRCNSKASYLPRQSLEKLNNSDPDHGSYKLTLTSNEDLVANIKPTYDILNHNGKIANNNLPDVLPLGAKLQPQPSSPTSNNNNSNSPLRYGSNNNLATTTNTTSPTMQQQQQHASSCYSIYPTQHRYSSPVVNSYNNNNNNSSSNNTVPSYARSQSYDINNINATSPNKFMSQSTYDLKRTQNLETTFEETLSECTKVVLSPAQSEINLSSPRNHATTIKSYSPNAASRESKETFDISNNKAGLEQTRETEDGRIFRAELVNTTLSTSPCSTANKTVTRKDSLRENIEKITQLQSQLMSAHLSDNSNSLLGCYSAKANTQSATIKLATVEQHSATNKEELQTAENSQQPSTTQPDELNNTAAECSDNDLSIATIEQSTPLLPKSAPPLATCEQTDKEATTLDATAFKQISQMDTSTDGLKLMQRSELVLRVNPTTTEAASQTDELPDCDMGRLTTLPHSKEDTATRTTLQPRQRHPIEIDCENISKELASLLTPNDKLLEILMPQSAKLPTDYVSNLYNPNVSLRPTKRNVGTSTLMRMKTRESHDSVEKLNSVTVELQFAELEVTLTNGSETDSCDLMKKKVHELIRHLKRKIRILCNEQTTIGEESAINDELGSSLIGKVTDKVRPIEATKFRTYIDDVGHITSLLLSLSERLARIENHLSITNDSSTEQQILENKRERLLEQLAEAKRLKADIERRGTSVMCMLEKYLSGDECADFDYFINMKAKLIADARDIADKIKSGEEQLTALSETLTQSDC